ncbi:MAG: multicomponent Na+:H+ antiporter subunit B [Verrucomicrobiales bacterium]
MKILGLIAVIITGSLLLYASGDFPAWGDANSPANRNQDVSVRYIEDAYKKAKTPNVVTAVLADYRGFDTMFETVVILVAGIAIISVLSVIGKGDQPRGGDIEERPEVPDLIIVQTCKLVIPILQIFALYVVAHGHYSPGGGFQGGVMMGASLILLALACGLPTALQRLSERGAVVLAVIGIVIYAGWGMLCLLMGANFLDYGATDPILPGSEPMAHSHSALIVETGVAFTVTAIMFAIYANLATRGRLKGGL